MPTVRYLVEFPKDDRPRELPGDTRAVLAETCAEYDIGQGGVTFEEVSPEDVAPLSAYPNGSELFVESPNASDCLDDSTEDDSAVRTRIWWRAIVVDVEPA